MEDYEAERNKDKDFAFGLILGIVGSLSVMLIALAIVLTIIL